MHSLRCVLGVSHSYIAGNNDRRVEKERSASRHVEARRDTSKQAAKSTAHSRTLPIDALTGILYRDTHIHTTRTREIYIYIYVTSFVGDFLSFRVFDCFTKKPGTGFQTLSDQI